MEAFHQLLSEYPEWMYGGVGATAFVTGGALIYKIATRKKPTHLNVNCWFCNENTVVPYGNRNCWDCPSCEQYNGFQENGDYNKTIPAQHKAHLNHGISGSLPLSETPKTLQWVNCQMLLCRKCNNNQATKIKQLASFIPRDDENYDEEVEAYKHHLEQTFKLCKPCQTAVEYYIKYQNRQLRTVLLSHQLRRTRDTVKGQSYTSSSYSLTSPIGVTLLWAVSLLLCAFLVVASFCKLPNLTASPSGQQTISDADTSPKPVNESTPKTENNGDVPIWQGLLELIPNKAIENAKLVWQHGWENQLAVVSAGLLTCLTAIFFAGAARLKRIDAVASVLWFLILCLYLAESYLVGASSWMDTAKHSSISLCCLVSFAAAVATRKPLGLPRSKYRRYLTGSSAASPYSQPPLLSPDLAVSFIPSPPPNLSKLISCQKGRHKCTDSVSTLPGRLSRALSLGTMPTLKRTDSGYLFSGSRPDLQYKDSPPSDYFSLKSGSHPSSPSPSPPPSIAGSCTSSSGSARYRRPLISPARLNISNQKPKLFSTEPEPKLSPPPVCPLYYTVGPASHIYSGCFSPDTSPFQSQNDFTLRDGSVIDKEAKSDTGSSSGSSACLVGTTTHGLGNTDPPTKGKQSDFKYGTEMESHLMGCHK
uniref:Transmembrane protein 201 n=1 Tax=Echeneis naucrates TaxID=173247 RepID=A0A665U9S0_ECHNA